VHGDAITARHDEDSDCTHGDYDAHDAKCSSARLTSDLLMTNR
jgi:hypothetical protein